MGPSRDFSHKCRLVPLNFLIEIESLSILSQLFLFQPVLFYLGFRLHVSESFDEYILLRNDEIIISSISVTDIVFDVYLGKWNYRAIPKVKTWSYFLIIPKSLFFVSSETSSPFSKVSK